MSKANPLAQIAQVPEYRANPFRLLDLPSTATNKEISRQLDRAKVILEMGQPLPPRTTSFLGDAPPDLEALREAGQMLKDPAKRIVSEFFWFWPMGPDPASDPGMKALKANQLQEALDFWYSHYDKPDLWPTGFHNIAVFYHLYSIECIHARRELTTLDEPADPAYPSSALTNWKNVTEDESIWQYVRSRIKVLDDPRVNATLATEIKSALPAALLQLHAEAALRFAQNNQPRCTQDQIQLVRNSPFAEVLKEEAFRAVLDPTEKRYSNAIKAARPAAAAEPKRAVEIARSIIKQSVPMLNIFSSFYGKDSVRSGQFHDDLAELIRSCAVENHNADLSVAETLELCDQTLVFAVGAELRKKLREERKGIETALKTQKENQARAARQKPVMPLYDCLKEISESKGTGSERYRRMQRHALPMLRQILRDPDADAVTVGEAVSSMAWALRGVAVDLANNENNFQLCREAMQESLKTLALTSHQDPDLVAKLAGDFKMLNG